MLNSLTLLPFLTEEELTLFEETKKTIFRKLEVVEQKETIKAAFNQVCNLLDGEIEKLEDAKKANAKLLKNLKRAKVQPYLFNFLTEEICFFSQPFC